MISERFDPGPQFDLGRPCAARLAQNVEISLRNCIRIEKRIWLVIRFDATRRADAAIDHEMSDMDALRLQFAREAL